MLVLDMVRRRFACVLSGLDKGLVQGTAGAVDDANSAAAAVDDADSAAATVDDLDSAAAAVDDADSAAAAVDDTDSGWQPTRCIGEAANLRQYTTMTCSFFCHLHPGCTMACFTAFVSINLQ